MNTILLTKEIFHVALDEVLTVTIFQPEVDNESRVSVEFKIESKTNVFNTIQMKGRQVDCLHALTTAFKLVGLHLNRLNELAYGGGLCEFKDEWPNSDPYFGFLPFSHAFSVPVRDGRTIL